MRLITHIGSKFFGNVVRSIGVTPIMGTTPNTRDMIVGYRHTYQIVDSLIGPKLREQFTYTDRGETDRRWRELIRNSVPYDQATALVMLDKLLIEAEIARRAHQTRLTCMWRTQHAATL